MMNPMTHMNKGTKKTKDDLLREVEDLRSQLDLSRKALATDLIFEEGLYNFGKQFAGRYLCRSRREIPVCQSHAAIYWGYSKDELIGMDSMSLVHPDDRERVRGAAIEMLKGERNSSYEFRTIAKDGDIRWLTETVTSIHYKGARAVLGNSMDITEQIKARDKLADLEALEASILEAIPHAVIGFRDRHIIFANDGVQAVFGWRADELIGMRSRVLYRTDEDFEEIAKKSVFHPGTAAERFRRNFPAAARTGTISSAK